MANKTNYKCSNCNAISAKWAGQCKDCGEWNTLNEVQASSGVIPSAAGVKSSGQATKPISAARTVFQIGEESFERQLTGISEFDRVLGGGIVPGGVMLLAGEPGVGKALDINTPLKTPQGWTTMGRAKVGDQLVGSDGLPTTIIAVTPVMLQRECYELIFSNNQKIIADAQHEWVVYIDEENSLRKLTTINLFQQLNNSKTIQIPLAPALENYLSSDDILDKESAYEFGLAVARSDETDLYLDAALLSSSIDVRLSFIQAIINTSKSWKKNTDDKTTVKSGVYTLRFSQDKQELLRKVFASLGIEYKVIYRENSSVEASVIFNNNFINKRFGKCRTTITSIKKVASVAVKCVQVDNYSHTYLAGELLIPTHNSTLLLEVANKVATKGQNVLIASGEESDAQIAMRARRVNATSEHLYIASESVLETILGHVEATKPALLVVDSIQTIASKDLDGRAGERAQVTEVATVLTRLAKSRGIPLILVGHVTKEGSIAGPRTIEHLVDVVMQFEGDRDSSLRMLRGIKNRYGVSDEIGCFEHADNGINEVLDPSGLLIGRREEPIAGVATSIIVEGQRALPIEIQSLVHPSHIPVPRKATSGLDGSRTIMLQAALEKHGGIRVSDKDVYVSTVAGLKTKEPAVDLACVIAIISAAIDIKLPPTLVAIGEVSLSGEIRKVPTLKKRLEEAKRLGFKTAIIPEKAIDKSQVPSGIVTIEVRNIAQTIDKVRAMS